MKDLEIILKQEPIYLHNWKNKIDLISDFDQINITSEDYEAETALHPYDITWVERKEIMKNALEHWKNVNILFASYGQDNYTGDAWVLFENNGKLYEVNGSHCSCYGLEGQWSPEETTLEAIEHRLVKGEMGRDNYSDNEFAQELKDFLGIN
jgi:hypothetical protein